jgi:2'-5' RNA ligase
MDSPRLFVALEVPGHVRNDLREALEPWRGSLPGARWVPPENWHVTLLFLGATDPGRIDWVSARLEDAAAGAAPFDTALTTFGGFPSSTRARVIWAGLDDRAGQVSALARSVGADMGAEPEDRPFAGHVTVAKSPRPLRLSEDFIATPLPAAAFKVEEMVLFRSHPGRPVPRYEPLTRFAFGSSPT